MCVAISLEYLFKQPALFCAEFIAINIIIICVMYIYRHYPN